MLVTAFYVHVFLGGIFGLLVFGSLYFIPSIVGAVRQVPNIGSIVVINLFLGWTFIGWVVALAMACRTVPARSS